MTTSEKASVRTLYAAYTPAVYVDDNLQSVSLGAVWSVNPVMQSYRNLVFRALMADLGVTFKDGLPDSGVLVDHSLLYAATRERISALHALSLQSELTRLQEFKTPTNRLLTKQKARSAMVEAHHDLQTFLRDVATTFSQVCLDTGHQKLRVAVCWCALTKEQLSPSAKFVSIPSSTKDAPYV